LHTVVTHFDAEIGFALWLAKPSVRSAAHAATQRERGRNLCTIPPGSVLPPLPVGC